MDTPAQPAATPAPEEAQSSFELIVTSTPVLLTVIATFMIRRSTGEMTNAQYFRAVASQNQSKVGDQWGFFQAKRIRGQIMEGNADLLAAQSRRMFHRDTLIDAAKELADELQSARDLVGDRTADKDASVLSKDHVVALTKLGAALKALHDDAEKLAATTKTALYPPAAGWKGARHMLEADNVPDALAALQNKKSAAKSKSAKKADVSDAGKPETSTEQAALLKEVIADIKKRKHESEIGPKAVKLDDETLNQAIKDADAKAEEVYDRGKRIENVLEELDALLAKQTAIVHAYEQIASGLKPLLKKTTAKAKDAQPGTSGSIEEMHKELVRLADMFRANNARLQGDYKAARHAFGARRYEDDARSNQDAAFLYEAQVMLNSARSDKHLFRSKMYMLAMLLAQAGVTIATLAIGVQRKSIPWLLAAFAGLLAIAFGVYVYLDLWPMPTFL